MSHPLALQQRPLARASGGNHFGPQRVGDLHRGLADAAGRRMDQHSFSRL